MRIAIVCQLCAIVATMNAPHRALHSARGVVFGRAGWRRSHAGGELAVAVWPSRLAACGVASCSAVAFGCGGWPWRLARRGVGTLAVAVGRGGLAESVCRGGRPVALGRGVGGASAENAARVSRAMNIRKPGVGPIANNGIAFSRPSMRPLRVPIRVPILRQSHPFRPSILVAVVCSRSAIVAVAVRVAPFQERALVCRPPATPVACRAASPRCRRTPR